MMHKLKWDDLHFLLLAAREGSVAAAARLLGVTHTTVARRIHAFEQRQGVRVFDRLPTGYTLTHEGRELMASLQSIEGAINDLQRRLASLEAKLEGVVKVTTTDSILISILAPHLATFQQTHPRIMVEMTVTNSTLNLARREADVAVRPSSSPSESLVGQRVSGYGFGMYASEAYLLRHPGRDSAEHDWLGQGEPLARSPAAQWQREHVREARTVARADSFVALHAMAVAGLGLVILPCCLAERSGVLAAVRAPMPELDSELWVLSHDDLRRSAPVRAFIDHVTVALRGDRAIIEGRSEQGRSHRSAAPLEGAQQEDRAKARCGHAGDGERRAE